MSSTTKLFLILTCLFFQAVANVFAQEDKSISTVDKINNLTILSEDNMTYPLVKIARLYCESHNSTVSINFGNSKDLIKNIDDGEPADVFISSHQDWTDELKQKGLVDVYNLSNLAKDRLVLVVSKNNNKIDSTKINQFFDAKTIFQEIKNSKTKLVVDSIDTVLGKYTKMILQRYGVTNQKIDHIDSQSKISIADFINDNEEYWGIILASSVKNYDNILVLKTIEDIEIHYQALVIAGNNMSQAREFLEFIKSKQAKEILAANGFLVE